MIRKDLTSIEGERPAGCSWLCCFIILGFEILFGSSGNIRSSCLVFFKLTSLRKVFGEANSSSQCSILRKMFSLRVR